MAGEFKVVRMNRLFIWPTTRLPEPFENEFAAAFEEALNREAPRAKTPPQASSSS